MPGRLQLLLAVWREACQHIEIQDSVAGMFRLVSPQLPLARIEIVRVEPDHPMAAVVAMAPITGRMMERSHQELSAAEIKRVMGWIRRSSRAGSSEGANAPRKTPAPSPVAHHEILRALPLQVDEQEDVRLLALCHGEDTFGVAAMVAPRGVRFTSRHEALLGALAEPLSAALANDRRLHELAALREAAEADRRSLLRRLGRTDITERVVGAESGLSQVMARVELVSQSDAPVLLLGETGTGKEVIARAVHQRSGRRDGPFIRVNCGAIPRELIDSQLFGHEKGAFTGAGEVRRGWFERADGGTLFLDEIGELPADAQVRFLRVLQDSFIERVGGGEPIRVDVRVIAATHRDLAGMVQSGAFREDLWYRIAVFPILLPPLRERIGDIQVLAEHFAERAANRFGLTKVMPSEADLALLRGYAWPGNIRELGAVIDRAAILGEGRTLEVEAALGLAPVPRTTAPPRGVPPTPEHILPLESAMRAHIEQALVATQGRVDGRGGAADLLRINPHTLRSRMRKLGVDWRAFRPGSV